MTPPRIVLHIGRNKAGSTTIQDFCLARREELERAGVDYVPFGHLAHSVPGVPGAVTFEELVDRARARPHRAQLVSNEFLFGWPAEFTDAAAAALGGCDVRLIAYLRPYDAWIVSAYAEETRRGMNTRDIDAYLDAMRPRLSAWPYLAKWAEAFGWERLRLRDLPTLARSGVDLVDDLCAGLGVARPTGPAPASNASPHWLELELARELAERDGDVEWVGVAREVLEPLQMALRPLLPGAPPRSYLAAPQARELRALYAADLARLARTGVGPGAPPAPVSDTPPRGPPPAFADAPAAVLRTFFEAATDAAFAGAHPAAAARARRLAAETG